MANIGAVGYQSAAQALALGKQVSVYTKRIAGDLSVPRGETAVLIAQAVLMDTGVKSPKVEDYWVTMEEAERLIAAGATDERDYIETTIARDKQSTTWLIYLNGKLHKSGRVSGESHDEAQHVAIEDASANLPGRVFARKRTVQSA
jgi:hypothetical protein